MLCICPFFIRSYAEYESSIALHFKQVGHNIVGSPIGYTGIEKKN